MNLGYLIKRFFKSIKEENYKIVLKKAINFFLNSSKIDLDNYNVPATDNLDKIFIRFGTDKGSIDGKKIYEYIYKNKKFKNYFDWIKRENLEENEFNLGLNSSNLYEKIFERKKDEKVKVLEIGVANGHSVASWQQYFKKGLIFGIDKKKLSRFFYKSKRIKYFDIDIFNERKILNFVKNNKPFDYIIDDSLHEEKAILTNLKNFFPSIAPGGIYFIEDFKAIDFFREKVREYQINNGGKYMVSSQYTIREVLNFLNNKEFFKNPFLNQDTQKKLFEQIDKVEIFENKNSHPLAAIGVIYKKNNEKKTSEIN